MSEWDAAAFDRWLTTPPEEPEVVEEKVDPPGAIVTRFIGECTRCGGEGCRSCEGDEGDWWDEEAELGAMEASYEEYLGRS